MSTDGLSAPGSSTYDSSTMFVGDGTWDASRNSFLLPNLQGLNFDTMRYNGMGNRFRDMPQYRSLIIGHGVMAAITFIGVVPAAILIARFYHSGGRLAYKLHVYLQIMTVFLATVVFTLGWFAVGPERSLTNPHHGIGLAIYVCVLVQFIYGWWMSKRERKRTKPHPTIPLKVHIHRLFGRAVAMLAFVQIALGLTLYGSPKVLFILYALVGALLVFLYLALEYRNKPRIGDGVAVSGARSDYYSDYSGSYLTGDRTELTHDRRSRRAESRSRDEKQGGGWAKKALAGAGLFGAYKWWSRRREKEEDEDRYNEYTESNVNNTQRPGRTPGPPGSSVAYSGPAPYGRPGRVPSRPPPPATYDGRHRASSRGSGPARRHDDTVLSPQSWENDEYDDDEKYGEKPPRDNTWRNRLLGAGAGIAAFQGLKSMFGSKKRKDNYVDSDVSYRPPPHGMTNTVSQTDVSRVEAGHAPFSPHDPKRGHGTLISETTQMTPSRPPNRRRPSVSSVSYDDEASYAPPPRPGSDGPNLRESIATMGAIAGFREWNKRRKDRNERQKQDQLRQEQLESEEQYNRRNSNRYPRPQDASGRRASHSDTLMTGPEHAPGSNPVVSRQSLRPDISQPPLPMAAGAVPMSPQDPVRYDMPPQPYQQQSQQQNTTFVLPPPPPGPPPADTSRPANYAPPPPGSLQMPPGAVEPDPSRLVSEQTYGQSHFQDGTTAAATSAALAGAALAATQRPQSLSPTRRQRSRTGSKSRIPGRRGSMTSAGPSQASALGVESPPVSLKMKMHPDGQHVTLRRLNEEEAAAERAARRRERRSRRASSLSSADEGPSRYRRNGAHMRDSSQQPISNVPVPPPAMSNSLIGSGRPPSELNLPTPPPHRVPQASESPSGVPPVSGPAGSGMVASPGNTGGTDLGTGTDVSAFDNNRKRRRAERARRLEASRGNRVEFS
ncbi:hypothetical protein CB0940_00706 [Cercospora beticola]|uniref:Cytochrome b561 domain-containing protein n=1 Tax=Cercospora beticola TaxID=122368 RepID=A0A2G5IBU4_CERBT|nr:hypothetical protein CB0940_00706 [Cercospora beticola]PIB02241.1 hypothetical protein CB0940_00706 [Cercospora beticola]WPA96133.1 hypothetical protein RHO25_000739 [Cercospora beticola]CAK1355579.1 unnamed protein product [Cercospora beticola]